MPGRVVALPEFKALVEQIANDRPEYTYIKITRCLYVPGGCAKDPTARCIIGETLSRLGWMDAELAPCSLSSARHVLQRFGFDPGEYASYVQRRQDQGMPWGEAIVEGR